ncbi:Hypothetical predicted protein [Pelobates cultripes]|uniref:Uncharacterized protein n=1 Tax=Pelobates cultripes TaxID=61616 RepID=A0AAD1S3L7_PELCU|nr:Hypothetical predicted protein [Pelobates cultripes]
MATTDPDPQEFQSLLDTTMSKSISKAISSDMGAMSSTISDSITQALKQVQPHSTPALTHTPPEGRLPGRKALTKRRHSQDPPPCRLSMMARNNRAIELLGELRLPETGKGLRPMMYCLTQTRRGMRGLTPRTLTRTRTSSQRVKASRESSSP